MTVLLSNRSATATRAFDVATGLAAKARWQGFPFTPDEAVPGTPGVPISERPGDRLPPASELGISGTPLNQGRMVAPIIDLPGFPLPPAEVEQINN